MVTEALIIFARKPEIGKVKTRLASSIGDQKALDIYLKLLEHTRFVASELSCDKYIFLTEKWEGYDFWNDYNINLQHGNDLGERMLHSFERLFEKGYEKVMIIGSDCPKLSKDIVQNAFDKLSDNDVVLGPAEDGGYYLLGMNNLYHEIFKGKNWSTENVLQQTISDLKKHDRSYSLLETLSDVDEIKDVPTEWL